MTAEFVLDSSLTMAWCFEDEASPETDEIQDWLISRCSRLRSDALAFGNCKRLVGLRAAQAHYGSRKKLAGSLRSYKDPFGPAISEEEIEAFK